MNTIQTLETLETRIKEIEYDIYCKRKYFEKNYYDVEQSEDGNFYYYYADGSIIRQFTDDEVNEYLTDCEIYQQMRYDSYELYRLKEHRKNMSAICDQIKTFSEVKSLENSYILNDDVIIRIAEYLTGICNKPIKEQLRLFRRLFLITTMNTSISK